MQTIAAKPDQVRRQTLPIPDRVLPHLTTYDAKDPETSFPPIEQLRPPVGAPNVSVVLIDDCGFGASSAFGGPISTPTFERLAAEGLRYSRFHTTALCSPTRAALLSGRNHHSVGMGSITELATSAPGYTSLRPNTCAPLAETLKLNGHEGKLAYCYNLFGLQRFKVYSEQPIPAGEHQVRMEFTYDGGGLGKGGSVALYVDGKKAGEGLVAATVPMLFSADETTDVGNDGGTPVSDDHGPKETVFTGRVNWIQLDIDEAAEDLDHLITPEERLRIAMARQ